MHGWRFLFVGVVASMVALAGCASAPRVSSDKIDDATLRAMQVFNIPGAVVGVVKDGNVIHSAAYGVLERGRDDPVDTKSLFRIASTTKAMTTAALAILVDRGQLSWDDKVSQIIPEFQLKDPWVTEHFTVTDLLTHRSGLAPFAGDLMLWPKPNHFTRPDIIRGLRYFEVEREFRTGYDYDNLLYVVAGELVPALTGHKWERFVDQEILGELGLQRCFAGTIPESEMNNLAAPHAEVDGEIHVIERNRIQSRAAVAAAAGGVRCSLEDMLGWIQLQLARGKLPDGEQIFSESQSRKMWAPHTIMQIGDADFERYRTHFKAYGLGWRLADVNGYKQVYHSGSFTGFNSLVVLIPELDLGAVVMLNASAGNARTAIVNSIIQPFLLDTEVDWVEYFSPDTNTADAKAEVDQPDFRTGSVGRPLERYTGFFRDPWFGGVEVSVLEDSLRFRSMKSPKLEGRLWPQTSDTFMLRWEDRTAERDVFVDFLFDKAGDVAALDVRCLRESIKCAFRDQEMDFRRVAADQTDAP